MKKNTFHHKPFLHLKKRTLLNMKKKTTPFLQSMPEYKDFSKEIPRIKEVGASHPFPEYNPAEWEMEEDACIEEMEALARYNEELIDILDQTPGIEHFFNLVPLSITEQDEGVEMDIDLSNNIGTYANLIKRAEEQGVSKDQLDEGFDVLSAQKYALLQLWIKAEDAHGGNILIGLNEENHMVPFSIDFGRCLGYDLSNGFMLPRTTRWERWPALELELDEQIKQFILKQNPEILSETLKREFFERFADELTDKQKEIFNIKIQHLHANMIMVQEAVKKELVMKQILALILPVVDADIFHFVTQGVFVGGELWPARRRFASLKTSFREAWDDATRDSDFDSELFRNSIREEIEEIKAIPSETLNDSYFQEVSFELRRGLYL